MSMSNKCHTTVDIRHQVVMATEEFQIIEKFNNFTVQTDSENDSISKSTENVSKECTLPLQEVYKLAYNFYKGNNYII